MESGLNGHSTGLRMQTGAAEPSQQGIPRKGREGRGDDPYSAETQVLPIDQTVL